MHAHIELCALAETRCHAAPMLCAFTTRFQTEHVMNTTGVTAAWGFELSLPHPANHTYHFRLSHGYDVCYLDVVHIPVDPLEVETAGGSTQQCTQSCLSISICQHGRTSEFATVRTEVRGSWCVLVSVDMLEWRCA